MFDKKAAVFFATVILIINIWGCSGMNEFMRAQDGKLYLNGKPFYEISFNKYDLFNIILSKTFSDSVENNIMYENAKKSLETISKAGFKTIRTFFHPGTAIHLKTGF